MKALTRKFTPALRTRRPCAGWPPLAATPAPAEFVLRRRDRHAARGLYAVASPDRVAAALTWNVFQTLRLIAPSFWIRRLRARLVGLDGIDYVPLSAAISLWGGGDASSGEALPADVLIETDHEVCALLALYRDDLESRAGGRTPDPVADLIGDVTRLAGVRDCYVGVITTSADDSPRAVSAIERHAGHATRPARLPTARHGITKLGVGWATWGDLRTILQDAAWADALDPLERDAAERTVRWLASIGIGPAR